MNLEDVLNEAPMKTLERVRQRLRANQTTSTLRVAPQLSTFSVTPKEESVEEGLVANSASYISRVADMDLNAILEAAGIDTTQLGTNPINLGQGPPKPDPKSILTLSSLEYPTKDLGIIEDIEESILHLTAVPIQKTISQQQSVLSSARSFVSLSTAVSDSLKKIILEGPQVHFDAYTKLSTANSSIDYVEG